MPSNALVTPLVTRDRGRVGALRNALVTPLVTAPLPNPSQPDPVVKTFMAESSSNRPLAQCARRDDLDMTLEQGEAR
jgi:hypothetical protein